MIPKIIKTVILLIPIFSLSQVKKIEKLDNGMTIYKNNAKFGISKTENIDFIYDSIYQPQSENFIMLKKNGKWGTWDFNGNQILPFEYEAIRLTRYHNDILKGLFYVKKNGKLGTVDNNNKIVIPIEYEDISRLNEHTPGAHYVVKDKKTGIVSFKGKIIIPILYDSIYYYSTKKLIKAKKGIHVGILNSKNKIVLPFKYQNIIFDFHDSEDLHETRNLRLIVKENNKWSIINLQGKILKENIPEEIILKEYTSHQILNYDFKYATICLIEKIKNYR